MNIDNLKCFCGAYIYYNTASMIRCDRCRSSYSLQCDQIIGYSIYIDGYLLHAHIHDNRFAIYYNVKEISPGDIHPLFTISYIPLLIKDNQIQKPEYKKYLDLMAFS